MANQINDKKDLMRSVQEACDELDRKEMEKAILQRQKEDAERVAEITTKANEELVKEIRELNYKSSLYGTTKKSLDLRDEECHINVRIEEPHNDQQQCNCPQCQQQQQQQHQVQPQNDYIKNNQDVNIRIPFFKENKATFLLIMGFLIILLLATGFTPSGEFWTAIQDQWITLFADVFKMALVVVAGLFIYHGVKK